MSALFDPGREGFLDGSIDWDTDDIRVMLSKSAYSYSAAHKFVSDVVAASDNGRSAALGTKTVTNGIANAAGTSLVATSAVACNALIVYKYNAADGSARLICYSDITPFTPSAGQTVNITWDSGANKIFKL